MMIDSDLCLPQLIERRAGDQGDRVAVEHVAGGSLTYAQLHEANLRWAAAYRAHGVERGQRVVVMLPPSFEVIGAWLGLAWIGAIFVPVSTEYRGALLAHALATVEPVAIVLDEHHLAAVRQALADQALKVELIVVVSGKAHGGSADTLSLEEFLQASESDRGGAQRGPEPYDVATIPFTSGTTGRAKGVVVYWQQLHDMAHYLAPIEHYDSDDAFLSPFPWHHASAMFALYLMVLCGGRLVLRERFSGSSFLADVRAYRCTSTLLIGAMSTFLAGIPERRDDHDTPLDKVLALPLMADPDAFRRRFGVRLATYYSTTELSGPIVSDGFELADDTSCGRARPGYSVRIVDAHDREVADGEVGELIVRTDEPWAIMGGYWNNAEATTQAWRNLWYHTGDAFRRVGEDYYFVDRLKDVIRRRGENISSWEVEQEIQTHPAVSECAVVACPSRFGEDEVRAFVVPSSGDFTPSALRDYLIDRVPRYMIPYAIDVVAELPKTPTQKVSKVELRERPIDARTSVWEG